MLLGIMLACHPNENGSQVAIPEPYEGYEMVWNDEFEGSSLSEDWVYDLGDGCPDLCGWGNEELQFYRKQNAELKDGHLVITAKKQTIRGKRYTSARIKTQGRQAFTFGRIDIRAKMPEGQGIWPALWMLGESITEVGWPACGEIDIMEMIGGKEDGRDNTVHGHVHWEEDGKHRFKGGKKTLSEGILGDEFRVYSIIWKEDKVAWLLDDEVYHELDISRDSMEELRRPHFLIMNLAVGGKWPGNPDEETIFPQEMYIDYVRVYQEK